MRYRNIDENFECDLAFLVKVVKAQIGSNQLSKSPENDTLI